MSGVSTTHLRLFTGDGLADAAAEPPSSGRAMPESPQEVADRLYTREAFRAPPGARRGGSPDPYSRAWFDQIAEQRYGRHGYWLPKVLEFRRHAGETVLGLGEGLGTDWLEYARNGANVLAGSPSQEQLALVRRNFELHDLAARFLHAPPHALPVDENSVDVVCLAGLLHEVERPEQVVAEAYRVLRPGGKVIVLAPARYDAAFWFDTCYPWRRWFRPAPDAGRRAYTARSLKRAFTAFADHKVSKRHLRRLHLPHLWRFLPLPLMERLCGQFLILKAFKPLSAALTGAAAAA
jgi:ubiquinone/menaquinone biosynthesis C-methylase UbiE